MGAKKTNEAVRELREKQRSISDSVRAHFGEQIRRTVSGRKRHGLLNSVATGLYDEVDKLSKKAPAETITDLMCDEMNQLVSDVTALIDDDPYVKRLKPFVPAGENPQNRDVLMVLRSIRQGLARYQDSSWKNLSSLSELLLDADTVSAAIAVFLEGDAVTHGEVKRHLGKSPSSGWFGDGDSYVSGGTLFDFDALDSIDDLRAYLMSEREDLGEDPDDDDDE